MRVRTNLIMAVSDVLSLILKMSLRLSPTASQDVMNLFRLETGPKSGSPLRREALGYSRLALAIFV
jgi:hypothetical protein